MPVIGNKRRNSSEATCDSSHCAFCLQRSVSGRSLLHQDSCSAETHGNSVSRPSNEFETWLLQQTSDATVRDHISLDKMGLPSSELDCPPSKRNRASADRGEASSSDSSDPHHILQTVHEDYSTVDMPSISGSVGPPWQWTHVWAERPLPVPAAFTELGSFQALSSRGRILQHTADMVSGVGFSPDGRFLASAGVAKQVFHNCLSHQQGCCFLVPLSSFQCSWSTGVSGNNA